MAGVSNTANRESPVQAQTRIHILGIGSVGTFVAHALRGIPDPPSVTLLFHSIPYARKWEESDKSLTIITGGHKESRTGFEMEFAIPQYRSHGKFVSRVEAERLDSLSRDGFVDSDRPHAEDNPFADEEVPELNKGPPINNLILTTKATSTVAALLAVRHRLNSKSTIVFLQNGMGIIEEVNEMVFPNPAKRPQYLLGINSHGLHSEEPFVVSHAGFGTISLGMPVDRSIKNAMRKPKSDSQATDSDVAPDFNVTDMATSTRHLYRTMIRVPVLAAVGFSPTELMKAQLDKLAVNCVINPLTALTDCRNGTLLYNMAMSRIMRLLLSEITSIFIRLPELQGLPNINTRFSPERLETLAVGVARKTGQNISSTLADLRKGKRTEIDYINGYVVKRGEEMGIHAGFNYMVQQLVKGKQQAIHGFEEESLPFVQ